MHKKIITNKIIVHDVFSKIKKMVCNFKETKLHLMRILLKSIKNVQSYTTKLLFYKVHTNIIKHDIIM